MLVSPAPRSSMVLGKILGSATLAWIQGLIFLAFAPLAGVSIRLLELIPVAGAIFLISFTLTGLVLRSPGPWNPLPVSTPS